MQIGFTGTRKCMTVYQLDALEKILGSLNDDDIHIFHHGDCLGADYQADEIAFEYVDTIHLWPCTLENQRAHCENEVNEEQLKKYIIHEPREPLARNHDIVAMSEILIAAPKSLEPELRSGTWATIRYAKAQEVPVIILVP